jgi:hypothetical protein
MYCAGCGEALAEGERICAKCGRAVIAQVPPLTTAALEENGFLRTLRRLSRFHLYFAGLNAALGLTGLAMMLLGNTRTMGPWEPWPHPPMLEWTYIGAAAWSFVILRAVLSLFAWHALKVHAECGRPVAMVAGVLAFTQFPIGLILGAWTLAKLTGKRSAGLYAGAMRA